MNFDFYTRAAILGFGSFFLMHTLFAILAAAFAAIARHCWLDRINPRSAASVLLTLRLAPALFALALTLGVLTPSYLQFEREAGSERVSIVTGLAAAAAGAAIWIHSASRSLRALSISHRPQQILETKELFLAVAGIFRPKIIVSRGFLEQVPASQRDVALRHEMAHFRAADNLKRLLLLVAPPLIPGCNWVFDSIDQSWARYAERAADDRAIDGDPEQATLLAEVLVLVARSACHRPGQCHSLALASTLVDSPTELRSRVERLIRATVVESQQQQPGVDWISRAGVAAFFLGAPAAIVIALSTGDWALRLFHAVERFLLHA